jgi:hypothetical protein
MMMRLAFNSTAHPLNVAKSLKRAMSAAGWPINSGKAREIVARTFGYADWHELEANASTAVKQSAWDAELDPIEQSQRLRVMTGRMSEATGWGIEAATTLCEDIHIMSRRSSVPDHRPDWRKRLESKRQPSGLLSESYFDSDEAMIADYRSRDRSAELTIQHDGEVFIVIISRTENLTDSNLGAFRHVNALLVHNGRIVGRMSANVFKQLEGGDYAHFYYASDCVSDEDARIAHLVAQAAGDDNLFDTGRGLLVITTIEVALDRVPALTGDALVGAVCASLRKSYGRFGAMAVIIDPMQFGDIKHGTRLSMPSYLEAREKLRAHFSSSRPNRHLGDHATLLLVNEEKQIAASPQLTHMLQMRSYPHPFGGSLDDEAFGMDDIARSFGATEEDIDKSRESFTEQLLAGRPTTATSPDEPKQMPPEDFHALENFDTGWALMTRVPDPHRDLWKHMPSDLVQIILHYEPLRKTGKDEQFRHPGHGVTFAFANGTHLRLPSEYLMFGEKETLYPPDLISNVGIPMTLNPFTELYSPEDMMGVLTVNTALLFSGDKDHRPLEWPVGDIVLTRPR